MIYKKVTNFDNIVDKISIWFQWGQLQRYKCDK